MSEKPTFVSQIMAVRAIPSDIDDWVSAWHDGNSGVPLHAFLGFTEEQYAAWVAEPDAVYEILESYGWTSPDVDDTTLFKVRHDVPVSTQLSTFQNATLSTVGDMGVSIAVTAPTGLDYRQAKVVNDLFRAAFRRLVDVGCTVEIQIGRDDGEVDEAAAVDAILAQRSEARG